MWWRASSEVSLEEQKVCRSHGQATISANRATGNHLDPRGRKFRSFSSPNPVRQDSGRSSGTHPSKLTRSLARMLAFFLSFCHRACLLDAHSGASVFILVWQTAIVRRNRPKRVPLEFASEEIHLRNSYLFAEPDSEITEVSSRQANVSSLKETDSPLGVSES